MPTSVAQFDLLRNKYDEIWMDQPNRKGMFWQSIVGMTFPLKDVAYEMAVATDLMPLQPMTNDDSQVTIDAVTSPYNKMWQTTMFSLGINLSIFQREKDQSRVFTTLSTKFRKSLDIAMELSVADVFNNRNSSSYTGPDGSPLASATHFSGQPGVFSNISTAATPANDVFESMVTDVKVNHKTIKGQKWVGTGQFDLLQPPQLQFATERILTSTQVAGSGDNDKNVLRSINWVTGNPFFTSTKAYALVASGEDNPIFLARGMDLKTKHQDKFGSFNEIIIVGADWLLGWKTAQGIQINEGL